MTQIVGLDIGNGYVKVAYFNGSQRIHKFAFASSVGALREASVVGKRLTLGQNTHTLYLDGNSAGYMVGDYAEAQTTVRRGSTSDFRWNDPTLIRVLALTALGMIATKSSESDFRVVTGLPITHFDAQKTPARKALNGTFNIRLNGRDLRLNVETAQLGVVLCTYGAWADFALDADGYVRERARKQVYLDIGTGTTDFTQILWDEDPQEPVYVQPKSRSIDLGWSDVIEYVSDRLVAEGAQNIGYYEIDSAIRQNRAIGDFKIADWTNAAINYVAGAIKDNLLELYGNGRDVDALILCGGPATVIAPRLAEIYPRQITVAKDPFYSSARGYFTWGKYVAYQSENAA